MAEAELRPRDPDRQPDRWNQFLSLAHLYAVQHTPLEVSGRLTRLAGLVLEAQGLRVPVGSQCLIANGAKEPVLAEVVGFNERHVLLMPLGEMDGLHQGSILASKLNRSSHQLLKRLKLKGKRFKRLR